MPAYKGEYENILRPFFDGMRYKLHANRHKGTRWQEYKIEDLFKWLRNEVDELEEAIEGGNTVEIMLESCDCANFACMISVLAIKAASEGGGGQYSSPIDKRRGKPRKRNGSKRRR